MSEYENPNETIRLYPVDGVPSEQSPQHPVLASLNERIATLEESLEKKNDSISWWSGVANARQNEKTTLEQNLRNIIVELHNDNEITSEIAEKILDACNIEATKTVAFSGAVSFSGSVEVSLFTDESDIRYSTDIDSFDLSVFGQDVYNLDYEVDEVDVDSVS